MYNDSELNITTHVPLSDGGGGGCVFSVSSNPPTDSAPTLSKEKRFRRGDVNPSDGTIFWCYERDKRVDGSVHVKERWMTLQRYAAQREWKKLSDARYMNGEAFKARAAERAQATKRWAQSERGRERAKIGRQKPENKERRRAYSKKYSQRPGVAEKKRAADLNRYQRLKHDPAWAAKVRERTRRWQQNNQERYKELQRQWNARNRGRQNELAKAYVKRRYAQDLGFALAYRLRARVYQAIKASGASKSGRTEELVGCSIEFLRQHIERQFKGKMSWDSPSSYHIDHIVPIASFDLTDIQQQRVAFNWQNMRPLTPKKNISKGAKLTEPQLHLPLTIHSTTTCPL